MSVVAHTRVSIAGLGAIGRAIAQELDKGGIPGMTLGAVSARNKQKAQAFVSILANAVPVVELAELGDFGDIVVECAPAALLAEIAEPVLARQKQLIVLSVGAQLPPGRVCSVALRPLSSLRSRVF